MMEKTRSTELVLQVPIVQGSKGRNGVITVTHLTMLARRSDNPGEQSYIALEGHSRRRGIEPPIQLTVSLEDAVLLAAAILQAVRDVCPPLDPNVEWPWCESCNSWHHPENPTCRSTAKAGVLLQPAANGAGLDPAK